VCDHRSGDLALVCHSQRLRGCGGAPFLELVGLRGLAGVGARQAQPTLGKKPRRSMVGVEPIECGLLPPWQRSKVSLRCRQLCLGCGALDTLVGAHAILRVECFNQLRLSRVRALCGPLGSRNVSWVSQHLRCMGIIKLTASALDRVRVLLLLALMARLDRS
jgi:hypothetical protein